ncbi:response regulator transcription factor [Roseobacter sp. N2S]|uniref:response regulator transcription factor n=1 Tax=Roseobacter sp. N2S TaxID=2663844 RepID=UPI00285DF50E|nr:response regulator transcription factor [Roseobacter sp. N2S]MDR6264491.1 two-component system OmpR family response regulator [Roseobacter sp. N2S]
MRLLLVEDEAPLARALVEHLKSENHLCDWFDNLTEARLAAEASDYDLVLLDLQLPDGDGLTLLSTVRGYSHYIPIIIMTARDKISDRIKGLNLGADDYVIKPFDLQELSARIHTVTRRNLENASQLIKLGPLEFDLERRSSLRDGQPVQLTAKEWSLLEFLLRRANNVIAKSALEEALYSFEGDIESNAIEAHISRLRAKLGKDVILTHRGLGYSITR